MANIKKCDRCGKTYPWEYKPTHARVMVYDDKQHLHGTDLCPECDKAAAEWMKKGSVAVGRLTSSPSNVEFAFENCLSADFFIVNMRRIAYWYGIATMEDAKKMYASLTLSAIEKQTGDMKHGWSKTSFDFAAVLKTSSGWVVRLPEPVCLDVCRKG
jgi:NAD-dependent SIR2 family protein deacetylase